VPSANPQTRRYNHTRATHNRTPCSLATIANVRHNSRKMSDRLCEDVSFFHASQSDSQMYMTLKPCALNSHMRSIVSLYLSGPHAPLKTCELCLGCHGGKPW
jgi:hypothetical protein